MTQHRVWRLSAFDGVEGVAVVLAPLSGPVECAGWLPFDVPIVGGEA